MATPKAVAAAGDVLFERLEVQRLRIFQARAIVEVVRKGMDDDGEVGDDQQAQPFWWSLMAVSELLDDIAHRLDPAVISARKVANGTPPLADRVEL
jgi:hypothetical protein